MLAACLSPQRRVIQIESIKEIVAVAHPTASGTELLITAWFKDTRLSSGEPQVQRHGDALRVEVRASAKGEAPGHLDLRLKIPAGVTTVEFGRKGAVVWSK